MASWRGVGRLVGPLLLLLQLAPAAARAAAFVEVAATFGGAPVALTAISGSGEILLGRTLFPGPYRGLLWIAPYGWLNMGAPPGQGYFLPWAASFDGLVVVGSGNVSNGYRYELGTWQSLFPGDARAVSDDGSVVAGDDTWGFLEESVSELWIWQEGLGNTFEAVAISPSFYGTTAITGGGTHVIGNLTTWFGHSIPKRFTVSSEAEEDLPVVPEGTSAACLDDLSDPCRAEARAVSADGSTVVGSLELAVSQPTHAVRWVGSAAPVYLDAGPPDPPSVANDVSGNGRMIVGQRAGAAFLWTAGGAMQDLKARLEGMGIDLTGWTLANALAISDDGGVIAGTGTRPGGAQAIWIAQAPELVPVAQVPALGAWGGVMLAIALAAVAHFRRIAA